MTRHHFVVRGRVQGIGYRWFVRDQAQALGLAGWVRNREDGAVELEAEGPERALERLKILLESGHPNARVDEIEARVVEAQDDSGSFEIRRTE